ncbi:MAG: HAD family hydrolase [Anaerolineales bacterium]
MTSPRFRYLLFDLGGTLMHAEGDWSPVTAEGDYALSKKLAEFNIQLESKLFREHIDAYYSRRDQDFQETTYHFVLRDLLSELGYADVDEAILRSALDALYAVTQKNWGLENDASETILQLKSQGYQLGILSNAGDDKDVQTLIDRFGIRAHFDFVLTSATCFYRKPHARAFEFALAHWSISPEEAIMIGDSLEADIQGAKNLNMKTIWITRRAQFKAADLQRFKPDFSIRKLNELLPTLERISISQL